ncbi:hypothetical protein [Agarivorans sp. Alg241-V36]|uniref:hypothetical protein n=1 Tax=Agarivorans sp. Alg241-V36 TaxID=2305992 RepID=UPI0013D21183|nr:hypothetical protein [Agarivorans sp. Alg241-V36]
MKPIFDKQQELNEKSSLVETLTFEVESLEKDRGVALNKLDETETKLSVASAKLKDTDDRLKETAKNLDGVNSKLSSTEVNLYNAESKLVRQTGEIAEKRAQLDKLQIDVARKNEALKKLTVSLSSSENAAITFYVYRVVNEVVNDGIRYEVSDLYSTSTNSKKFNLYDALIEKSEFSNDESVEKFSQKYFEREAKLIIRQFAEEKIAVDESGYKPAFELYTYTVRKQMGMSTE